MKQRQAADRAAAGKALHRGTAREGRRGERWRLLERDAGEARSAREGRQGL